MAVCNYTIFKILLETMVLFWKRFFLKNVYEAATFGGGGAGEGVPKGQRTVYDKAKNSSVM